MNAWCRGAVLLMPLLCLSPTSMSAQNTATSGESFRQIFHVNGKGWTFVVDDRDLRDSPNWFEPGTDAPPMSTAEAVSRSKDELGRYTDHPELCAVSGISIHRLSEHSRWFYIIDWRKKGEESGDPISIAVLMSGRVIKGFQVAF